MRAFIDFPDPSIAHDAGPQAARWQARFEDPLQILTAWRLDEVPALLRHAASTGRRAALLKLEPEAIADGWSITEGADYCPACAAALGHETYRRTA